MIWGFHLLLCDIGIGCVAMMSVRSEGMLLIVHHSWAARTIFLSVPGMVHYSIAIVVNVFSMRLIPVIERISLRQLKLRRSEQGCCDREVGCAHRDFLYVVSTSLYATVLRFCVGVLFVF